jgi:hypothetical protein
MIIKLYFLMKNILTFCCSKYNLHYLKNKKNEVMNAPIDYIFYFIEKFQKTIKKKNILNK